jgi:hypothetical protein
VVAFTQLSPETGGDVYVLELDAGSKPRPFVQTMFNEGSPRFSPDGRFIGNVSVGSHWQSQRQALRFRRDRGSAQTGLWVSDGMTFYLQDVTSSRALTAEKTLATLVVNVKK